MKKEEGAWNIVIGPPGAERSILLYGDQLVWTNEEELVMVVTCDAYCNMILIRNGDEHTTVHGSYIKEICKFQILIVHGS